MWAYRTFKQQQYEQQQAMIPMKDDFNELIASA